MAVVAAGKEYFNVHGVRVVAHHEADGVDERTFSAAARAIEEEQLFFGRCACEKIPRPFLQVGAFLFVGHDLRNGLCPKRFFSHEDGAILCAGDP